jgi:hypothetical protein
MKIKLTESDLIRMVRMILEDSDDWMSRMKRRQGELTNLVEKQVEQETNPDNFSDEFEYADNILSWALDEFINQPGNEWLEDKFDELLDYAKEEFGDQLFDIYYGMTGDEDEFDDEEFEENITEQFNREQLYPKDDVVRMLKGAPTELRKLIKKLPDIPCENDKGERTICTKIPETIHVYLTGRY